MLRTQLTSFIISRKWEEVDTPKDSVFLTTGWAVRHTRKFKRIKEKVRGVFCIIYWVTKAPVWDPGTPELFLPQTPGSRAAPSSPDLRVKCSQLLRESTMHQAEFCCSSPLVTDSFRSLSSFRDFSHYPQYLETRRRNIVLSSHNAELPITIFSCDVCVNQHMILHESTYSWMKTTTRSESNFARIY